MRQLSAGSRKGLSALALLVAVALTLVAAAWLALSGPGGRAITAFFRETIGLYPGSTVRVLGIPVGTVDAVVPQGNVVRVEMSVDRGVALPAGASAAVVAPSLVSDRYVQVVPAFAGGPELPAGAVIPVERTATPVELDALYRGVDQLATALGPNGANREGALSRLLDTLAKNANGNGPAVNETIRQLGALNQTLAGSKDDLFGTVGNLQQFVTMLADNDRQVAGFSSQLADVTRFLAAERDDIGGAVAELGTALQQVRDFIANHRDKIKIDVDKLAVVTKILVDQRDSLAEALDTAPNAANNLVRAHNPAEHTVDGRDLLLEWWPPEAGVTGAAAPDGSPALPLPGLGAGYATGGR